MLGGRGDDSRACNDDTSWASDLLQRGLDVCLGSISDTFLIYEASMYVGGADP
jgi:hypothetical protein